MTTNDILHTERQIAIGMITSTEYLTQIEPLIQLQWVQTKEAQIIMQWCLDYFYKYKKAPKKHILDIYMDKLKSRAIHKSLAETVEIILNDLSEEFEQESINVEYLITQTEKYCKICQLKGYSEQIADEVENGNILEAEKMILDFKPIEHVHSNATIPLKNTRQIIKAFESAGKPLIELSGALGDLMNPSLVQSGFVSIMAQNKGGKSWFLWHLAQEAAKTKKVAFFSVGDMSLPQIERRAIINIAKKSDMQKYCNELYVPTLDCFYNQNGECTSDKRKGGSDAEHPLKGKSIKMIKEEMKIEEFIRKYNNYPEHEPCCYCLSRDISKFKGSFWYKKRPKIKPLTWKEAKKVLTLKHKRVLNNIRLMVYPSETLSVSKMNIELDLLEKENFIPEVIIGDYLDVFASDRDTLHMAIRDQENKKWQRVRRLTDERKVLGIFATQSDAQGFTAKFLNRTNFSEDKRKLDHVTAMYGLNMNNEEKKKGLMRVNDIVSRETEGAYFVYVLHRLQIGQPVLGSFY